MAEHRGSEALPVGPTELLPNENSNDEQKTQEIKKERVGESPPATESKKDDLPSSIQPNSETLIAFPSSILQHQSFDSPGSPNTLNSDAKAENKETVGPPEKEITARQEAQTPPTQTGNQLQVTVSSTPLSELRQEAQTPPTQTGNQLHVTVSSTPLSELRQEAQTPPIQTGNQLQVTVSSTPLSELRQEAQTPPTQTGNQLQVTVYSTPLSELLPDCVTNSLSSVPSPTIGIEKTSTPNVSNMPVSEVGKKNLSGGKALSSVTVPRTPSSDGYNWRKYGQKQVKSPTTSSRSYYRCTQSNCFAKKIECWDHSGHVIETVYRSEHSHEPPRKINSIRESKFASSNERTADNSVLVKPVNVLKDSDPSTSFKAQEEAPCSTDKKQQSPSNNNGNGKVILKEEHLDEPEPKRRKEKDDLIHSDSSLNPGKKAKFVVHAAGDVGISGDGYRWRKYGQKMVKGNPHPRNYYRCTSAGCPVRKHIETAVDNSDAVIITYKGVHDHDTPVPKKRHGPTSAPLVAAAAPASMNNLALIKPDSPPNQKVSTQWSVGTEGELTGEAMELGGEKAIESAKTLLSIGFEIKPC